LNKLARQSTAIGKEDHEKEIRRNQLYQGRLRWGDLSLRDKARLFNKWSLVTLLANGCQIIGTLSLLLKQHINLFYSEFFCGMGCALCWILTV